MDNPQTVVNEAQPHIWHADRRHACWVPKYRRRSLSGLQFRLVKAKANEQLEAQYGILASQR